RTVRGPPPPFGGPRHASKVPGDTQRADAPARRPGRRSTVRSTALVPVVDLGRAPIPEPARELTRRGGPERASRVLVPDPARELGRRVGHRASDERLLRPADDPAAQLARRVD